MSEEYCSSEVSDYFVEQLAACGVSYVFGIPGGSILPIVNAIKRSDKIEFILVRNESTAAFMASSYAKLTGKLGVCAAISGAGATNLFTGLADAAWDKAPVLAITGQVQQEMIGTGAFQEIDQYGLFSSICVYNQTLQSARQISEILPDAVRASLQNNGVSHIGIPVNLQAETFCSPVVNIGNLLAVPGCPHPDALEKAIKIINSSSKPVILAGRSASGASDEIVSLANALKAPIATTPSAKGLIDEHDNYSIGVFGRLGLECSRDIFTEADLAILVDAGISEQKLMPSLPVIQILSDPADTIHDLETRSVLIGDIKLTLESISEIVDKRESGDWDAWAMGAYSDCVMESMIEAHAQKENIHPRYVMDVLSNMANDNAIFAVDIGDVTYWYTQFFTSTKQKTLLSMHLASMGFALPAALASKLEYRDRQVFCIVGDGGFGMSMVDFTTAVKYDLPIIVILFNNNSYGRVTGEQRDMGLPEYLLEIVNPDFSEFAVSCGGYGIRIDKQKDIPEALRGAINSGKPSIIEVIIDNSIHANPTLPYSGVCKLNLPQS